MKRFGKPQQIIASHMDELLKISVCSSERPSQLRYLYDKISVNVRGLEALGIKSAQYGSLLIPVIMSKLPPDIRIHVARSTSQDVWEIEPLLDLLQREIEAREMSERVKTVPPLESKRQPPPHFVPEKLKVCHPLFHPVLLVPILLIHKPNSLRRLVFTVLGNISQLRAKRSPN